MWKEFIPCDCGCEGILMSSEYENEPPIGRTIDLAFTSIGFSGREMSFKQKMIWIWRILTKGYPFTDMVTLNVESSEKLARKILLFTRHGNDECPICGYTDCICDKGV